MAVSAPYLDPNLIWRPFTQMQTAGPAIQIVKGRGACLYAADGREFLDAVSSWWVNLHGHAHPYIVEKIQAQASQLEHVMFSDFSHQPALELAARLHALLPGDMAKIFYSDNGSTAVEAALKMAIQYWHNQDSQTKKRKVICFKRSYHGDTFGAMAAAGRNEFHRPFWSYFFPVEMIDPPLAGSEQRSLDQLEKVLSEETSACFIFEPLVLGVGGMLIYPPEGLDALLKRCRHHNVLTIADEVMTGFGRTGKLFACENLKEKPDIICLSKGLTGGFLPLGVTACQQHVFDTFLSDGLQRAFLHGHSYTGNPIACTSALASLDLLEEPSCTLQREKIARCHEQFCQTWQSHPKLARCESLGTILALEYQSTAASSYFEPIRDPLYRFFFDRGIVLRPFGNVLHVIPPYCISEPQLQRIYEEIATTLKGLS